MSMLRLRTLSLLLAVSASPLAAITISQFNTAATEDFDTLATTTSSTVPAGWEFVESGTSANTTYGASTGSSSTGNTYSFGAADSTDRALGSLRTSGVAATFGTVITNNTGETISDLLIAYTGEQWRLGALGRVDRLDFSYSLDATSIITGSWTDVDNLDFVAPVTGDVTGALVGNLPENQTLLSHTIPSLNLVHGASLYLRWVDFDASSSDDGLAIDNVSITAPRTITGGGGGGGGAENVPENLPTGVIVLVLGGLMAFAAQRERWRIMSDAAHVSDR